MRYFQSKLRKPFCFFRETAIENYNYSAFILGVFSMFKFITNFFPEKLYLKLDFDFFIQRRNGELYIKCKTDKINYTFDIKGKMQFFADKLYIGKQESSKSLNIFYYF